MSDPNAPVRYSDDANLEPDEQEAAEVPAAKGTEHVQPKGTELPEEDPKGTELDGDVLILGPGELATLLIFGSLTFEVQGNTVVFGPDTVWHKAVEWQALARRDRDRR